MAPNFLPPEDEVTCINSCYNSGSSDSAAIASGIHRGIVSGGHPTAPPPHMTMGTQLVLSSSRH